MYPDNVVGPLGSAVDDLLDLDPDVLSDDELGAAIVELHRQAGRLAAAGAQLVGAFDARRAWADDGSRNAASWIAHRCRLPARDARAEVRMARRLRTMPATAEAFASGDIGLAQAQRLVSLNRPALTDAFTDSEDMLVTQAKKLEWPDFERFTAYWRQAAEPDKVADEAANMEAHRRVHLSRGVDGTGILDGELTPTARSIVGSMLERIEQELFEADWREARGRLGDAATLSDLARTPAQRRHDALVEMAIRAASAPADGKRPQPLITVFVGYETFAGRLCELADGTVIPPTTLDDLLPDGFIEHIVFDSPDRVMSVSEQTLFTGALRRAIQARDRHCTHPGCHVPAHRCQVDHIDPRRSGGLTEQLNGRLLCPAHHRWRHRHDSPPQPLASTG